MGLTIGNYIGIGKNSGKSYWVTRYISDISVETTSSTTQTITATIVGSGFDGVSWERSTDRINWTIAGTSANGTYNATGLTDDTTYFWRARLYKGSNYGTYSDIDFNITYDTPVDPLEKLQYEFTKLGFGAFTCFSLVNFYWKGAVVAGEDPNDFNPTDLDIDDWLDCFVEAGMKYVLWITKEEGGFALYPTGYNDTGHDPYSIATTTWYSNNGSPDLTKQVVDGCRKRGLKICFYYSIYDATHELWAGSGTPAYLAMIDYQLTELLTNYGKITALFIDDWYWRKSYAAIPYEGRYNLIKSIQPDCLIICNEATHPLINGEIESYEAAAVPPIGNTVYSQHIKALRSDGKWGYYPGDDPTTLAIMSKTTLDAAIAAANGRKSSYISGIPIDATGRISAKVKTLLGSYALGRWGYMWSSLSSCVVENATPSTVVLTFTTDVSELTAADFTLPLHKIRSLAHTTNKIITLTLSTPIANCGGALVITFNKTGQTFSGTNNVVDSDLDADVDAYTTGLTTPLSYESHSKLNTFVKDLKTALGITNLSDAFDVMYILGGETSEASLKNLAKNAHHATAVNAPTFTTLEGFTFANTKYLNTNYNPNTQGVRFTLNDCSLGIYSRTSAAQATTDIGIRSGTTDIVILCRYTGDNCYCRLNNVNSASIDGANTEGKGMFIASRHNSAGTDLDGYKNKTAITHYTNTPTSVAVPSLNLFIGCMNIGGNPLDFSTRQYSFVFAGKSLTQDNVDDITDLFEVYMDSNGKGVI